jgi:phosphoribosyl 1,2-cyclic phosphodiesterase
MQIEVLASSSKANSYVIRGENETLLLEAGLPIKELKQKLNFAMPDMCLISHEHGDHSKAVKDLIKLGIDCHMSKGTAEALGVSGHRVKIVGDKYQLETREFVVLFFNTHHDASEPLGFLIMVKNTGKKVLFATDTYYLHNKFQGVNVAMIECNYSKDILDENDPPYRDRIVQSHFELENLKEFFRANDLSKLEHVMLLHLSSDNSDETRFVKEITEVTGVSAQVARPGLKIQM